MNIIATTPLPPVLTQCSQYRPHRRHQVGNYYLGKPDLDRFNQLLTILGNPGPALDSDQIATAARLLVDGQANQATPACIEERMAQAQALSSMMQDHDWETLREVSQPAQAVLDYLHDDHALIPNAIPRVGHLDDAIVVEAAWPRLSAEVVNYLDFCRLRQIEAWLQAAEPGSFHFSRKQWQLAHWAEAELHAHGRRVRESSYVPASAGLFRVH